MAYPFVPAHHDYGPAKGPRLGVAWHMAEGGGTVAYLARPNPNGVSVHFVVERSGRIVQMLPLGHANGSIRPTAIRTTDDPPYIWATVPVRYGATAARAVLGAWWKDPNSATIGVEIEGYAKDGPNPVQGDALARLWADLAIWFPAIRSLGHRDFADYKACPGHLIPWDRLGGHGPEEPAMAPLVITSDAPKVVHLSAGDQVYNPDGSPLARIVGAAVRTSPYEVKLAGAAARVIPVTVEGLPRLAVVKNSAVTLSDPPPAGFTAADIEAAVAAVKASARVVFG